MPEKVKKVKKQKRKVKEEKQGNNKNSKLGIILGIIVIILLGILVGISFSKYQEKMTAKGFAEIAKPVLEVRRQQSFEITALKPKAVYCFDVRNYKEKENNKIEINEIEMEYYIEIISNTEEEIQFNLYQGEKRIPLNNRKTEKIRLSKEEQQSHSYRLEVTYDKEKSTKEENINAEVEIKIHSIQKA